MKLLFDQNISFRLVRKIIDVFPDSKQVRELGLEDSSDSEIFDYAKNNEFIIVTFDADFCGISVLKGFPPKIIWIRTGNIATNSIELLLKKNSNLILEFIKEDFACLEINSL